MKRLLTCVLFFLALPLHAYDTLTDGIKDLSAQIGATATERSKQKIAVLPFHELDGQPTILGTYVAEELVTNLVQRGNFQVVERQLLHKVLGELKIEQTGAIDPATAKQVGKLTGVDAIVTGSITDLSTFVAVNCRLIDAATGQVFGAAKVSLAKDSDLSKLMATALSDDSTTADAPAYATAHVVATKDFGMLRVALKSVIRGRNGVVWTFELTNRDAQQPLLVAMNADTPEPSHGVRFVTSYEPPSTPLRASLIDAHGGSWKLSSVDVNLGFVSAGVHGRHGNEMYSPLEIARLMTVRDQLGRDIDDPADGMWAKADSIGEGGSNVTFSSSGGNISPEKFFRFRGNTFISGTPTTIAPGKSMTVTMTFRAAGESSEMSGNSFQFTAELVIGNSRRGYKLESVAFDRVSITTDRARP